MSGTEEALLFLEKKSISLSEKDFVREEFCDKKTRKALKWYEKSAYLTNWNREEEAERTKKVYTEEDVKRQQKRLKILGWILIAFVILIFFAGAKYMVAGWVSVLLFVWFLYIYLYPRAYIEKSGKRESSSSRGGTDYYISGNYKGENMDMTVSRNLFKSAEEGSLVQICERESIFGLEYWNVHE